ncbi:hypothetical protein [Pseudomonas sp. Fl4BN1]|uniref:hypothetical protein n=1 Tax=Pseudomonas sp. Fl4BN1 TaxID=2697651 RepID=UPI0013768933|nr:hypothetical protein [Pseudomonas sp. Fl4BN1]NBF09031.1 hypothetical protein [Pseudomonas sp. Fl4BN1]
MSIEFDQALVAAGGPAIERPVDAGPLGVEVPAGQGLAAALDQGKPAHDHGPVH